jgi:membrane protease YdiL (CAAX protease family)
VGAILLGCLVGFLAGEILASALVTIATNLTHFPGGFTALSVSSAPPWWSNALGLVGLWCGFASAIYFAAVRGRLAALAHQWRPRPGDAIYVLVGVGCQFGVDLIYYPFHFKKLNGPVTHLFGAAHGATFVLLVVMTTFLAPVFEEWFFRGVIFRTLDEGLVGVSPRAATAIAVAASAVLFALAHGEPLQFAGLALFGVVLALVIHRTRRLVPSVITHVSFNAVAMVGLIVQRSGH